MTNRRQCLAPGGNQTVELLNYQHLFWTRILAVFRLQLALNNCNIFPQFHSDRSRFQDRAENVAVKFICVMFVILVVVSTDFAGTQDAGYPFEQTEEHEIGSISTDKRTITLTNPLAYMHYGAENQFAEVG